MNVLKHLGTGTSSKPLPPIERSKNYEPPPPPAKGWNAKETCNPKRFTLVLLSWTKFVTTQSSLNYFYKPLFSWQNSVTPHPSFFYNSLIERRRNPRISKDQVASMLYIFLAWLEQFVWVWLHQDLSLLKRKKQTSHCKEPVRKESEWSLTIIYSPTVLKLFVLLYYENLNVLLHYDIISGITQHYPVSNFANVTSTVHFHCNLVVVVIVIIIVVVVCVVVVVVNIVVVVVLMLKVTFYTVICDIRSLCHVQMAQKFKKEKGHRSLKKRERTQKFKKRERIQKFKKEKGNTGTSSKPQPDLIVQEYKCEPY